MSNDNSFSFFINFFSISSTLIFQVFKSQSINTGLAFCFTTARAFDIIVKFGIITSSPFLRSSALIAISKAEVPFATAIEYFFLIFLEKFFQIF